jgi:hypothetical protein
MCVEFYVEKQTIGRVLEIYILYSYVDDIVTGTTYSSSASERFWLVKHTCISFVGVWRLDEHFYIKNQWYIPVESCKITTAVEMCIKCMGPQQLAVTQIFLRKINVDFFMSV